MGCRGPQLRSQEQASWEKPLEIVDMLNVRLRRGYIAAYYAAPLIIR